MMKKYYSFILCLSFICFSMSSCTFRLVDYTVISSKNVSLNFNKKNGKTVEGTKSYFLGIGWNLKDALDNALEQAGPGYDLLVDGVVSYSSLFFFTKVTVKGTAISSEDMAMQLGEEGFEKWLSGVEVFEPEDHAEKEE